MPKINGKIYYNNVTGNVLLVVNQNEGVWLRETTFAEDVATYPQLKEVASNVISVIRLAWDQYKDEFSVSYPVKVDKGKILWRAHDQVPETEPEPSFTDRVKEIEKENQSLKNDVALLEDMLVFMTMP